MTDVTLTHSPAPPPSRIEYIFEFNTRFDRPLFDSSQNRTILAEAIHAVAIAEHVHVLGIDTMPSAVKVHVSALPTVSASTLLTRMKNAAAIALRAENPKIAMGVFRRRARIAPGTVPTHVRHRAAVVTRLARPIQR